MTIKVVKMNIRAVVGIYYLVLLSMIGGDDDLDQRFSTCESQLPRGSKDLFIGASYYISYTSNVYITIRNSSRIIVMK